MAIGENRDIRVKFCRLVAIVQITQLYKSQMLIRAVVRLTLDIVLVLPAV